MINIQITDKAIEYLAKECTLGDRETARELLETCFSLCLFPENDREKELEGKYQELEFLLGHYARIVDDKNRREQDLEKKTQEQGKELEELRRKYSEVSDRNWYYHGGLVRAGANPSYESIDSAINEILQKAGKVPVFRIRRAARELFHRVSLYSREALPSDIVEALQELSRSITEDPETGKRIRDVDLDDLRVNFASDISGSQALEGLARVVGWEKIRDFALAHLGESGEDRLKTTARVLLDYRAKWGAREFSKHFGTKEVPGEELAEFLRRYLGELPPREEDLANHG